MVSCLIRISQISADTHNSADAPTKDIHTFYGVLSLRSLHPGPSSDLSIPLNVENVLWANTVLAAGSAVGLVVYTGKETRAVLNTSEPETKMGSLEAEINKMAKVRLLDPADAPIDCLQRSTDPMFGHFCSVGRFGCSEWVSRPMVHLYLPLSHLILVHHSHQVNKLLVISSSGLIQHASLRVNLDMGKTVYAHQIQSDREIPGTIVRTSTLPEELGRIEYLLSDKTGTLTRNGKRGPSTSRCTH